MAVSNFEAAIFYLRGINSFYLKLFLRKYLLNGKKFKKKRLYLPTFIWNSGGAGNSFQQFCFRIEKIK